MAARQYSSVADAKTLQGTGITSAGQTTITLNNITNLPSIPAGSGKTFTLVLAPDTATEEIITVSAYGSGTTLTVVRGQEGTTAQSSHPVGTIIKHMITARDLQEPQDHIAASSAVHGLTGSVVGTSDAQELTNKTLGNSNNIKSGSTLVNNGTISGGTVSAITLTGTSTNSGTVSGGTYSSPTLSGTTTNTGIISGGNVNGVTINSASTIGGISGTTIANDHAAWTSITPTVTSGWTGTPLFRYIQIGKTVHFRYTYSVAAGGSTATEMTVTLPVTAVTPTSIRHIAFGEFLTTGGSRYLLSAPIVTSSGTSTFTVYYQSSGPLVKFTPTAPTTSAGNDSIVIAGTYEAA